MLKAIQIIKKEDLNPILSKFFLDNISKKRNIFFKITYILRNTVALGVFFSLSLSVILYIKINAQVFYLPVSFKLLFLFINVNFKIVLK
jgi:hypothetical protein